MNKRKLTILCIMLVLAITCVSVLLTGCNDESKKQDAVITANDVQDFIYDGTVHNVVATLNHDETSLTYSPSQGYKDVGEYEITISSKSTKHYKSATKTVKLRILNDSVLNRWNVFLGDVTNTYSLGSGDVKFNVAATANTTPKEGTGDNFKLSAVGNLDLTNKTSNNTNMHLTFGMNEDEYGIFYQKGTMYLKINNDVFSLNNVSLDSLITGNITTPTADEGESSIVDTILGALPLVLFSNKNNISNADGVWTLKIDVSSIWSKFKSIVLPILGSDILSDENIKVIDGFLRTNKTNVTLKLDLNKQNAATAEAELDVSTYGSFKANITSLEIANGAYENVEGALTDAQMSSAKAVNLANVKVEGTLNLVNTLGEAYEHLNWRLVVDIDPFALMNAINSSNGIDWLNNDQVKKMKVYFSLFHKHQAGDGVECTDAMCPTRAGGMEDTTLLDVAFDPQNFGDSKLYVAANLSRILSESSLSDTLKNVNGLINTIAGKAVTGLLSENFMTAIDLTKTITPSTDDGSGDDDNKGDSVDIKKYINPIFDLLTKALVIQDGSITLDMEQTYAILDTMFDIGSLVNLDLGGLIKINTGNIKDAVFKGLLSPDGEGNGEKAFKSLSLGIDSIEFGVADSFDCKNAITHDPVDSSKARAFEGSKPLSFENANAKATGKVFNTKQSYEDYTAEKGIHATIEEFEADVVGKIIEYTYTAMDGQTYTAYTQIIAYEGLDKTKLDVPQTIKAIVLPLDGKGGLFSDTLWSVLKALYGTMASSFLPSHITLPIKGDVIDMTVTLTEIEETQFAMTTPFENAYNLAPYDSDNSAKIDMTKHLSGTIDIKYTDGFTRTISANCSTDLVDGKYLVNDGNEYTVTLSHYSMPNVKKDFKVKAETPSASLSVDKDGKMTITTYGPTQGVKINVILKTSSYGGNVIDPSSYQFTIKGQQLSDITISATEAGTVDFAQFSDIVVKFSKDCYRYEALNYVTPYFYLSYPNGTQSVEVKYTKSYKKLGQVETWGSISKVIDLGANLNDKLTYNYWLDSDAEYDAPQRTLSLKFEDGKYYMIDNDDASVKIEATVTAWDYYDKTKTNILVNGLVPFEKLKELSYDTTNKTSKTVSLYVAVSFMLDGRKVELKDKSISFNAPYEFGYGSYMSKISASSTFNGDVAKFVIVKEDGIAHDMRLTYKNGKYVLEDTYKDGDKYADIEVQVTANIAVSSSVLGDEITLTDGMLGADQVGKKVTITVSFTYDGKTFTKAVQTNKTVA